MLLALQDFTTLDFDKICWICATHRWKQLCRRQVCDIAATAAAEVASDNIFAKIQLASYNSPLATIWTGAVTKSSPSFTDPPNFIIPLIYVIIKLHSSAFFKFEHGHTLLKFEDLEIPPRLCSIIFRNYGPRESTNRAEHELDEK